MTTRDAAFGIVLPIGSLGSSQISIDLGAGLQEASARLQRHSADEEWWAGGELATYRP